MKIEKKYYSISEVAKMLDIKEHIIRHWDSIDPSTNRPRIENLSIRTKGGTRFFNKYHIKRILNLNNLLRDKGKRNYTLDLASKILSQNKKTNKSNILNIKNTDNIDIKFSSKKLDKLILIQNNLKKLLTK